MCLQTFHATCAQPYGCTDPTASPATWHGPLCQSLQSGNIHDLFVGLHAGPQIVDIVTVQRESPIIIFQREDVGGLEILAQCTIDDLPKLSQSVSLMLVAMWYRCQQQKKMSEMMYKLAEINTPNRCAACFRLGTKRMVLKCKCGKVSCIMVTLCRCMFCFKK